MRKYNFEWYVLNEDMNHRKIVMFNIFNNISLYEETVKLCEEYDYTGDMSFEEFTKELRRLIQWQEWARREYEIMVAPLWSEKQEDWRKIDCYQQAEPNIERVAEHVLKVYEENKSKKMSANR